MTRVPAGPTCPEPLAVPPSVTVSSSSSAAQAELSVAERKLSRVMLEGGDLFLAPAPSSSTSTRVGERATRGGGGAWKGVGSGRERCLGGAGKGLVRDWGTERGERRPAVLASCPAMGSSPFQAPLVDRFGAFHSWYPNRALAPRAERETETRLRLLYLWRVGVFPGFGTYGCSEGKLDPPLPHLPCVALKALSYALVLYY